MNYKIYDKNIDIFSRKTYETENIFRWKTSLYFEFKTETDERIEHKMNASPQ